MEAGTLPYTTPPYPLAPQRKEELILFRTYYSKGKFKEHGGTEYGTGKFGVTFLDTLNSSST
jgi:hypothetical protein